MTRTEQLLCEWLAHENVKCTPQKAVGPYNVDVALDEFPIAVEIFGGHWHSYGRHATRFRKRFDYLLNAGWLPVIIWVTRNHPLEIGAAKYIISLTKKLRSGKALIRKEQMIHGGGQPCAIGKNKLDSVAIVQCPKS